MINRKTELLMAGTCVGACAAMVFVGAGCSGDEEETVAVAPAPPPPPPPPPPPAVTPIDQLMAEMNIDPRVSLPEDEAPGNDADRRALLSFFDGFARGNDKTVRRMLSENDRPQLDALVADGAWKDATSRITQIGIQCGNSPLGDKAALALIEVKGGGDAYQPQLWTYDAMEDSAMFEAQPSPPGILDRLSGDWISQWFQIIEDEIALASKPDEEYVIAQRDLDEEEQDTPGSGGTSPGVSPGGPSDTRPPPSQPLTPPTGPGGPG